MFQPSEIAAVFQRPFIGGARHLPSMGNMGIRMQHIAAAFLPTLLFFLVLFFPQKTLCSMPAADQRPFSPGETLKFQLKWGIIPVGEAVLEVKPFTTRNGVDAYHFSVQARSNAFIDVFYKVRDHIDAFADTAMTRSVHYRQKQQEGTTQRDITVIFDWKKKEAQHTNYNEKRPAIPIRSGTFDPLSVFYFARLKGLTPGTVFERWVTDGKRCVVGKGIVVRREKIRLNGRPVDTILFEPDCKEVRGVFEQSPGAKIEVWLTDDSRKIPVRIKSKVIVGSFIGELVSVQGVSGFHWK